MIGQLVVFGATGDLTGRFLLPALAQLSAAGALPDGFTVVGAATESWAEGDFRRFAVDSLEQHGLTVPYATRQALSDSVHYRPVDVTEPESVAAVLGAASELAGAEAPVAVYLALPTALMAPTLAALGETQLPQGSRIAVEKPFGEDLDSARELNALLAETVGEDWKSAVFRVDHALGMTTLANLGALRFDNRMFEPVWSSEHIDEVEVLWEETLALEDRAGFYDGAGALKDVMQNHMMQVLCVAAMERPEEPPSSADSRSRAGGSFETAAMRRSKIEVLRAVRPLSPADVVRRTRRARYSTGRLAASGGADGRMVPDYAGESGVDPDRGTETFAEVVLNIDTPRWEGTRFVLRAGKALPERRKGVRVHFRPVAGTPGNDLWVGIDGPDDVILTLKGVPPDHASPSAPMTLAGPQPTGALPPYAEVLLNLLQGRSNLSVGAEEAEEAWRILDPVRRAWDEDRVPLLEYPAGSAGPSGD